MKLGIFTDSHYSSQEITCGNRYNSKSLDKIKKAYEHFLNEKCDFVICLGDLIDKENNHKKEIDNLTEVSQVIKSFPLKTVVVMGNHDGFTFTQEEFYNILGENVKPMPVISEGKVLLFADACYFKSGRHYEPGDSDWTDTYFPFISDFEAVINTLKGEVYIFLHQNIDPEIMENHRLSNDREFRNILEKSGKVKTVYQGHYHPGHTSCLNGIKYITFPAMCENDDAYYTVEI